MSTYTQCFTEEARKAIKILKHYFTEDAQKVITIFDDDDNMIDGAEIFTLDTISFECLKQAARDNPDALQTLAKVDKCIYEGLTGLASLDNALDPLSQGFNDALSHSSNVVNKNIGLPEQATVHSPLLIILLGVALCILVIDGILATFAIFKIRKLHKAKQAQEKKKYERGEKEYEEDKKKHEENEKKLEKEFEEGETK